MSFDVHFQGFANGNAASGGDAHMRQVLAPFIVHEEPEHSFVHVEYGDGSADVYLDRNGMMANHVSGTDPWNLLTDGARAAGWVIMPVGCPTCITDEAQRSELPTELQDAVAIVTTGAELLHVITST